MLKHARKFSSSPHFYLRSTINDLSHPSDANDQLKFWLIVSIKMHQVAYWPMRKTRYSCTAQNHGLSHVDWSQYGPRQRLDMYNMLRTNPMYVSSLRNAETLYTHFTVTSSTEKWFRCFSAFKNVCSSINLIFLLSLQQTRCDRS